MDSEVIRLRSQIEAVDKAIVLHLAARGRIQRELFLRKAELGLAPTDAPQESEVLARAGTWAREFGGNPLLAMRVVAMALRSGKAEYAAGRSRVQEAEDAPVTVFLQTPGPDARPVPAEAGSSRTAAREVVAP